MAKLSTNEINKLRESEVKNGQILSGQELENGMSYSPSMLDLNELIEQGAATSLDTINLSQYPNVDTIQASSQEQLMMIAPESRNQINRIHLSNDTPVGWDGDFEMEGSGDEKIDLTMFENLEHVETHFYLNDDLKTIDVPDGVKAIKFQHSKLPNLHIDTQRFEQIELNHVVVNNIDTSLPNVDVWQSVIDGESQGYDTGDEEENNIYNRVEEDFKQYEESGVHHLLYKGIKVLTGDKPFEVVEHRNPQGFWENIEGFRGDKFTINGQEFVGNDNGLYQVERVDLGINLGIKNGSFVKVENCTDSSDQLLTMAYTAWPREQMGGYVSLHEGCAKISDRYDTPRGVLPETNCLFLFRDNKIVPESFVCQNTSDKSDDCGIELYNKFMDKIKQAGISLTAEEKEQKDNFLRTSVRRDAPLCDLNQQTFNIVKDVFTPQQRKEAFLYTTRFSAVELLDTMLENKEVDIDFALEVKGSTKSKKVQDLIKTQGNGTELLLNALDNRVIPMENLEFYVDNALNQGEKLADIDNIYGKLFSRPKDYESLFNITKRLVESGVTFNNKTFNDGYDGTKLRYNLVITDPAARLAVSLPETETKLYGLLVANIANEEDKGRMLLANLLTKPKGVINEQAEILLNNANLEKIGVALATDQGRSDIVKLFIEHGAKPSEIEVSYIEQQASQRYTRYDGKEYPDGFISPETQGFIDILQDIKSRKVNNYLDKVRGKLNPKEKVEAKTSVQNSTVSVNKKDDYQY